MHGVTARLASTSCYRCARCRRQEAAQREPVRHAQLAEQRLSLCYRTRLHEQQSEALMHERLVFGFGKLSEHTQHL